jgi:hypothetical protein
LSVRLRRVDGDESSDKDWQVADQKPYLGFSESSLENKKRNVLYLLPGIQLERLSTVGVGTTESGESSSTGAPGGSSGSVPGSTSTKTDVPEDAFARILDSSVIPLWEKEKEWRFYVGSMQFPKEWNFQIQASQKPRAFVDCGLGKKTVNVAPAQDGYRISLASELVAGPQCRVKLTLMGLCPDGKPCEAPASTVLELQPEPPSPGSKSTVRLILVSSQGIEPGPKGEVPSWETLAGASSEPLSVPSVGESSGDSSSPSFAPATEESSDPSSDPRSGSATNPPEP